MLGTICLVDERTGTGFWINLNRRIAFNQLIEQSFVCPDCHAPQQVQVCAGVNVSIDHEWKRRVLTGEFFRFNCCACGRSLELTRSFFYLDTDARSIIWLPRVGGQRPPLEPGWLELLTRAGYSFVLAKNHHELIARVNDRKPVRESMFAKWAAALCQTARRISGLVPAGFGMCRQC